MVTASEGSLKRMSQKEKDQYWMAKALEEAKKAMAAGEHPIGSVLVAGNRELTRGQTSVRRQESITVHGELLALKNAKWDVFSKDRPVVIYTTLEPCIMCIGATMQCEVDEIVFGMRATPDGGTRYLDCLSGKGEKVPIVRGGVLEEEAVKLFQEELKNNPNSPGIEYTKSLLKGIGKS